eukprot:scaffold34900_cov57-Phaeocystis_antarctica.AAC.1
MVGDARAVANKGGRLPVLGRGLIEGTGPVIAVRLSRLLPRAELLPSKVVRFYERAPGLNPCGLKPVLGRRHVEGHALVKLAHLSAEGGTVQAVQAVARYNLPGVVLQQIVVHHTNQLQVWFGCADRGVQVSDRVVESADGVYVCPRTESVARVDAIVVQRDGDLVRARPGSWRAATRQFLCPCLDPKLGVLFEDGAVGQICNDALLQPGPLAGALAPPRLHRLLHHLPRARVVLQQTRQVQGAPAELAVHDGDQWHPFTQRSCLLLLCLDSSKEVEYRADDVSEIVPGYSAAAIQPAHELVRGLLQPAAHFGLERVDGGGWYVLGEPPVREVIAHRFPRAVFVDGGLIPLHCTGLRIFFHWHRRTRATGRVPSIVAGEATLSVDALPACRAALGTLQPARSLCAVRQHSHPATNGTWQSAARAKTIRSR